MQLTSTGQKTVRILGGLIVIVALGLGLKYAATHGYGRKIMGALVPQKVQGLDNAPDSANAFTQGGDVAFAGLPSETPADLPGAPEVRINFWAWNSQMGCLYSNGGPVTTENSLMAKQGIRVNIERQDDNNQLMAQLTALGKAMHDGRPDPTAGVHFVGIMSDGAGAFLAGLNSEL